MGRGRVTHIRSLGGTRRALRWRRRGRRAMHQLNTDRQDIMRHRDRYLEPLEHHSVMNTCQVGTPDQKSQRRVLSGGPREKCSPAKLEKKGARRFEQQLLLDRHFQGSVPFCSSKGRMSQTAIGSPTTGGSKAAAAPSSAAGQSVNKRCVPRPPAWLDPRIRSSEHLRTARRQRLPGAPERARRVRCLPCPTELRHRSRSPGGSLVPPPPGCKRSS